MYAMVCTHITQMSIREGPQGFMWGQQWHRGLPTKSLLLLYQVVR
jgi:hypothetical protein